MDVARLRRLCATFVLLGLFLPVVPHALGFPKDRSCFDIRIGDGECGVAGLICLAIAIGLRRAVAGQLDSGERRWTLPKAFAIGLAWIVLQVVPWPFYWYWSIWR